MWNRLSRSPPPIEFFCFLQLLEFCQFQSTQLLQLVLFYNVDIPHCLIVSATFFEIASFASSCSFSFRHRETFVVAKVASGHSVAVCRPSLLSPITPSPSSQGSPLVVLLSQDTFVFVKIRSQALHDTQ